MQNENQHRKSIARHYNNILVKQLNDYLNKEKY